MVGISQAQTRTLDGVARERFHVRLADYLREVMPEETRGYSVDALREFTTRAAHRAFVYGIETESGIATWACLALLVGPDFGEDESIRQYLHMASATIGTEDGLDALVEALNEAMASLR